ncbi:hypothetical protein EYC98_03150 [Halieaceae bacterium IMCC14734]|uniref:Uncharacterized protein n=1 Tax=Candidatus Litorirhabdus singularis TaxID=2518993 RepID=A0ABT3TC59_9GAMM|nr:hypothetical protein [Candidatus Litorirhabdus singularis]MCX2979856.1 hypothetical protein [Candidatus Litorirhabdus singularis]
MPISPMDETLAHQTPETFDQVATSDRNFYDRYYFNLHPKSGDLFVVFSIGQYPNLGTTDAFVCIVYKGTQHVLRCSRELGSDRSDTTVGPFGVEVLEGLKTLRIYCEDNEHDIAFDLVFDGTAPAVEEPRTVMRKGARITMDTSRYTQMGRWQGSLSVKGEAIEIGYDDYLGVRDHSWGIRPVGESEPLGININQYTQKYGFFHMWAPLQFDDYQMKVFIEEDADGQITVEECVKIDSFERGGAVHQMGKPRHAIKYRSGTRELETAELYFEDDQGVPITVKAQALSCAYLAAGTGYFPKPDWTHGQYHGELKLEALEFDVSTPEARNELGPLYETLVRFETSTGDVTWGMFENMSIGAHDPYGFDSFEAVAD